MELGEELSVKKIREFVIRWNNKLPLDYWWRNKYNISFNSKLHREVNLIDIRIEYEEAKIFAALENKKSKFEEENQIYKLTGQFLKRRDNRDKNYKESDIDEIYGELDDDLLEQLDKKSQEKLSKIQPQEDGF